CKPDEIEDTLTRMRIKRLNHERGESGAPASDDHALHETGDEEASASAPDEIGKDDLSDDRMDKTEYREKPAPPSAPERWRSEEAGAVEGKSQRAESREGSTSHETISSKPCFEDMGRPEEPAERSRRRDGLGGDAAPGAMDRTLREEDASSRGS